MEVQFALVCDWASLTDNGKLNALGEFDNITAVQFPCTHLTMHYVAKILVSAGDPDVMNFELRIVGDDGQLVTQPFLMTAQRASPSPNGEIQPLRILLQIQTASFPAAGDYSFDLRCNSQHLHSVDLHIKQAPAG